jgi:hypothetical protein
VNSSRLYYGFCGVLLVVVGIVCLLIVNGQLPGWESAFWQTWLPRLSAVIGLAFLLFFVTNVRDRWHAAIPAFILLGLGAVGIFSTQLGDLAGPLFLASIGLGFLLVFLVRREFWWAIIPAGSLFSLAAVASITANNENNGEIGGAVMFFGFALTFLAIYFVRDERGRRKWALVPAAVCLGMAGLIALATGSWLATAGWLGYLGPAALIIGGAAILVGALRKKEAPAPEENVPQIKS